MSKELTLEQMISLEQEVLDYKKSKNLAAIAKLTEKLAAATEEDVKKHLQSDIDDYTWEKEWLDSQDATASVNKRLLKKQSKSPKHV